MSYALFEPRQVMPNLPNPKTFLLAVAITLIIFLLLLAQWVRAEDYSNEQIANAIWFAEGGKQAAFAYGIRSIPYRTIAEARRICLNTIRNNRKRYADYGHKQYPDFLSFLASRYCPTAGKLSLAERRLNRNWLRLVKYFLTKQKNP